MKLITTVIAMLLSYLPYANLREYHYNRPSFPFNTGIPAQARFVQPSQAQPQIIVHHYGATSHATRQSAVSQASSGYLPPNVAASQYQTSGTSQLSYNQAGAVAGVAGGQGNYAGTIAASYYPQQQRTLNVNPLTQYQQQPSYGNLPQVQQPVQYTQGFANGQQQFATNSYSGFGSNAGIAGQTQFGAGAQSGLGSAATGIGSQTQFGAGVQNGQGTAGGINSNYISQSESGLLHTYPQQQQQAGDTRPFSRQVTNCFPNGQCQRITLGPGQPDLAHQQAAAATRAKVSAVSSKCRQIAKAKAAAAAAADSYGAPPLTSGGKYPASMTTEHPNAIEDAGPVRPKDRRLYPYKEIVLPNDPYN